jgi:phosphoglycerate dehydrogenase-like enzyme
MLGAEQLSFMHRDAILVNVSRAGIVDDAALVELLLENRIFGAGLDVYEPIAKNYEIPNLVLTAHRANGETQASQAVVILAARNIAAVLSGKQPISPVTK